MRCAGDRSLLCILIHGGGRELHPYLAAEAPTTLKVPCSYLLAAMVKFALLRYLSEFRLRVLSS